MKVKFKQDVDIYPDGVTRVSMMAGDEVDLKPDYGQLMIDKGHADAVAEAQPETRGARK